MDNIIIIIIIPIEWLVCIYSKSLLSYLQHMLFQLYNFPTLFRFSVLVCFEVQLLYTLIWTCSKFLHFRFYIIFSLTPMFCYWASFSSIVSRKDFLWNLFIKWGPVFAMNLDLKQTFGLSGVLVEMWILPFVCFVLKINKVRI